MKKIIVVITVILALISCKSEIKKTENPSKTASSKTIETPQIALGEFNVKAGDFVNKEVKVQGIVDHVCKHGGKKILLVTDSGDVHVTSDERFDENLKGSEVSLIGVVIEERIDEAYCLKVEEDNIKSHSEGKSNKEQFESKKKHVQYYRNKMKSENSDHISNYSLEYVSLTEIE